MAHRPTKFTPRQKLIAIAPVLAVVGVTAIAASGLSIISSATAAGSTVNVVGTVAPTTLVDATPSGTGCPDVAGTRTFDFGSSWAGTPTVAGGGNVCTITFASTGGAGAQLMFENNTAVDTSVFCNDPSGAPTRSCAAGSVSDVPVVAGGANLSTADRFGIALAGVAGGAAGGPAVFGAGVEAADATPTAAEDIWYQVPDKAAPAELCKTTAPNTTLPAENATCDFVLGVNGKGAAVQPSGAYSGTINFTVASS